MLRSGYKQHTKESKKDLTRKVGFFVFKMVRSLKVKLLIVNQRSVGSSPTVPAKEKVMSHTGRFYVVMNGRTFCVEPIDESVGRGRNWGDVDPVTKKLTGSYGEKYPGAVHPDDSIITEANGFKNIVELPAGVSPMGYIDMLIAQGKEAADKAVQVE